MDDYVRVSRQVMAMLETISPVVEKVSIDEAYLDVSGLERLVGPPEVIGQRAKAAIREAVALTASVGIGPNRLIAKLASDYRKPDGLTVVMPEQVPEFLDPMPLTVLRGVGVKTAPRLQRLGLKTVGDVRRLSLEELRRHLGARAGTQVHLQATGIAGDQVYPASERKSISKETTFAEDIVDPAQIRQRLPPAGTEPAAIAESAQERYQGANGSLQPKKRQLDGAWGVFRVVSGKVRADRRSNESTQPLKRRGRTILLCPSPRNSPINDCFISIRLIERPKIPVQFPRAGTVRATTASCAPSASSWTGYGACPGGEKDQDGDQGRQLLAVLRFALTAFGKERK